MKMSPSVQTGFAFYWFVVDENWKNKKTEGTSIWADVFQSKYRVNYVCNEKTWIWIMIIAVIIIMFLNFLASKHIEEWKRKETKGTLKWMGSTDKRFFTKKREGKEISIIFTWFVSGEGKGTPLPFVFLSSFQVAPEELKIQSQKRGTKLSTYTLPGGLQSVIDRQRKGMNLLTKIKSLKAVVVLILYVLLVKERNHIHSSRIFFLLWIWLKSKQSRFYGWSIQLLK